MLEVKRLNASYGRARVLFGIDLELRGGEVAVLLGPNGAGKTTILKSVMGLLRPDSGEVRFEGFRIDALEPFEIARLGLGYVPEDRRIFTYFPVLRERWRQRGRSLSGGEQQMLAIARALAGNPELLMLDEPSQGLAPRLVRELESLMIRLKAGGVTILLVEQNARMALGVCDQVLVLGKGAVVFAGPTAEFRRREAELKGRYLSV